MGTIKIDIKEVREANYNLLSSIWNLSVQKRRIYELKRKISAEIRGRRNIEERLDAVMWEMHKAERQMNDLYRVTERAVTQYANMEAGLTKNASSIN